MNLGRRAHIFGCFLLFGFVLHLNFMRVFHSAIACSKLTVEKLEQGVKYVQI